LRSFVLALSLALLSFSVTAQAPAPAKEAAKEPVKDPLRWGPVEVSGVLDVYAGAGRNDYANNRNPLRNFDITARGIDLSMARLAFDTTNTQKLGFRFDVGGGRIFDIFQASEPTKWEGMRHVLQAYARYKVGKAELDFGKFYTSAGAELTESHTAWNYSRPLLYALGPYYHFGFRSNFAVTDKLKAGFQVLQGWNNVLDNNSGKTLGLTTAYTSGKHFFGVNYFTGPEKTDSNQGWRNFADLVYTVNVNDKFSMYINTDFGRERLLDSTVADWQAYAAAGRYQISPKMAVAFRGEIYRDADGFITGTKQNLKEVTTTFEYKLADWLINRYEFRNDWAADGYFQTKGGPRGSQPTFVVGLMAVFNPKKL
jgi:hypothetical protein